MVTFDSTDLDNAASESGVVHESTANTDHNDASNLKQGYEMANPYLSADLVGYWPLQEDSGGMAYDFSGNNNDGTTNGGVTQGATGLLGTTAYSFDGTDDYVNLPFTTQFSQVTMAGWFKWDSFVSDQNAVAIMENNDIHIWTTQSGSGTTETVEARIYDGSNAITVPANSNPTTGEFHHFAATWDGSTLEFYIDGTSQGTASVSSMIHSASNGNAIGVGYENSQRFFGGDAADVRVYNSALSSAEIQTLYDVVNTAGTLTTQYKSV